MRQIFVLNNDFSHFFRESLAGTQVKGNARPTPVINVGLDRDEGLGIAAVHFAAVFVKVSWYSSATNPAVNVLTANDFLVH